jgi:16S rRNA G966 N2-methylase RsmD
VSKAIGFLDNGYDVVFADPPYSDPSTGSLLADLARSKLLTKNSTVVVSHANRFALATDYDGLRLVKERRYGDSHISIYQKEA